MAGKELIDAAESGDLERVKQALAGETARDTASLGAAKSPVQEALYRGHKEVVNYLRGEWQLDIFEASALGDLERLDEVLRATPEAVNTQSYDGWTPLHLAAFTGHAEAAEKLLEAGAEVSALSTNYMTNTPLHAALAGAGSKAVAEALIGAGADVNFQAGAGVTPLHTAASRGSTELVEMLLAAGTDPAIQMDGGKTAADVAEERGHPQVATRLRQAQPKG